MDPALVARGRLFVDSRAAALKESGDVIEAGEGRPQDLDTLADTFNFMDGKCICALADGASWASRAFLKQFRADYEEHIKAKKCPFPESFEV